MFNFKSRIIERVQFTVILRENHLQAPGFEPIYLIKFINVEMHFHLFACGLALIRGWDTQEEK